VVTVTRADFVEGKDASLLSRKDYHELSSSCPNIQCLSFAGVKPLIIFRILKGVDEFLLNVIFF
jgi:hypothetical protein